jgi:ankyrin repeat protein
MVKGMTALMYAAQRGRFEVAKLLVENGADINKQVSNDIDSLKENNANC